MILPIYILLQIASLIIFGLAFFTKKEMFWGIGIVAFGLLIFSSLTMEVEIQKFNETGQYNYTEYQVMPDYPMMAFNFLFFSLSILYLFVDTFDNWGITLGGKGKDPKIGH